MDQFISSDEEILEATFSSVKSNNLTQVSYEKPKKPNLGAIPKVTHSTNSRYIKNSFGNSSDISSIISSDDDSKTESDDCDKINRFSSHYVFESSETSDISVYNSLSSAINSSSNHKHQMNDSKSDAEDLDKILDPKIDSDASGDENDLPEENNSSSSSIGVSQSPRKMRGRRVFISSDESSDEKIKNKSISSNTSHRSNVEANNYSSNHKHQMNDSKSDAEDPDKAWDPKIDSDTSWDENDLAEENTSLSNPIGVTQNPHKMRVSEVCISSDESSDEKIKNKSLSSNTSHRSNVEDDKADHTVETSIAETQLKDDNKHVPEEIVSLLSDEEIDIQEITKGLVHNKESNLKAERRRLELETLDVKRKFENLQVALNAMEPDKLPDKGIRLRRSLEKRASEMKKLNERILFIDKQLKAVDDPDAKKVPYMNQLPSASMNLSELGKKALETHNIHRALTMETLERLHKSLETQPKDFSVEPESGLKVSLLPHQKYGLGWALWRETQKPAGGILADDMGLGKTLTIISLILHTVDKKKHLGKEESSEDETTPSTFSNGGTLVVAPCSVMGQWENEIKTRVVRGKLSCSLYHGPARKKARGLSSYNVVLTTYATVQKEEAESPLMKVRWSRVVLDEAHTIRNAKSKTAKAIFRLKARTRWTLTGTPVQNKELDLYSLLRFLRCKPFDDLTIWKRWVDNKDAAGIQRLNCILKAILLRRTKQGIQSEGGLKSLQPKSFNTVKVTLDREEYDIYKKVAYFSKTLLGQLIHQRAEKENLISHGNAPATHRYASRTENPFKDHPELGDLYNHMMSMGNVQTHQILVLLLRLRQICCHPALAVSLLSSDELNTSGIEKNDAVTTELAASVKRMSLSTPSSSNSSDVFEKSRCSSKMRAVVECITNILFNTEDKIIVVSQWTSVLEILKKYLDKMDIETTSFDGSIPVKERPALIENFNERSSGPRVLLLSLAAGGTGLNLVGANHLLLIDVHWNPQLEAQACDRIYRVGQKKAVNIYKFVCMNTIEENIIQLQEKKLELAHDVLTGSMSNSAATLTLQDLKMLFNVK